VRLKNASTGSLPRRLGGSSGVPPPENYFGYLRDDGIKADTPDDAVLIGDLRAALEDLELEADDVLDDGDDSRSR
jgi:hypothetical protein